MKIVLKDADFSQSGIPTPHEVVLNGSVLVNPFTGAFTSNSNVSRGADESNIPYTNKKIINNANSSALLFILYYASDNTYLGCASYNGTDSYVPIEANGGNVRIDQCDHYMKPVDATHLTEMTTQEVSNLKANTSYWRLAVQSGSGNIADASISLEIVE